MERNTLLWNNWDIIHRQPGTFTEYIAGLREWDQEIINKVEILVSLDVLITFLKDSNLLTATDRPAEDSIMSFSWKTCNQEGKTYIYHMGPTFGRESSFHAEAYRVLSVVCAI
eukprot:7837384-Ditylum_brightwellii.AAC.1